MPKLVMHDVTPSLLPATGKFPRLLLSQPHTCSPCPAKRVTRPSIRLQDCRNEKLDVEGTKLARVKLRDPFRRNPEVIKLRITVSSVQDLQFRTQVRYVFASLLTLEPSLEDNKLTFACRSGLPRYPKRIR
jgi:hypothetical protein